MKKFEDLLNTKYGTRNSPERKNFEAKSESFYLCNMIAEWRVERGLTQKELSKDLGVKPEFLSRIENGKVDIQLSTFLKILNGIGKRIEVK